jgi:hypothetical protein
VTGTGVGGTLMTATTARMTAAAVTATGVGGTLTTTTTARITAAAVTATRVGGTLSARARRMRHHDAANRPERRPLAAVHFESRRRRPARWGLGSPGYRHWAAAAETDQCGRTTLALATECLAIAAVRHRALSARRAVFPVGYCSCPLNSKGPYLVRPSDGDDGSSISTMWHPIASGRDDDHLR